MHNTKRIFLIFLVLAVAGCATVPGKGALPTYSINGVSYVPLMPLCQAEGIQWNYDNFTRSVTLNKANHKVSLMVGQTLVLVDNIAHHLRHPVDIYQGTVVVPLKFKEQIIESYLKTPVTAPPPVTVLRIKKVVIDAGHGGRDPGAIGKTGLREKDVTLDLARRLESLLRADGLEVVLTRSSDKFISLQGRVDITNRSKADLFISIHANANRTRSLRGFEIYYVTAKVSDLSRALSASKRFPTVIDSSCFASSSPNLKAIVWDLIYTSSRAESIDLARTICKAAESDLETRIIGAKGANFYVLKGAQMPAVLIEVGFVSNGGEEKMLRNNYYRQQIVSTIEQGIKNYAQDYVYAKDTTNE